MGHARVRSLSLGLVLLASCQIWDPDGCALAQKNADLSALNAALAARYRDCDWLSTGKQPRLTHLEVVLPTGDLTTCFAACYDPEDDTCDDLITAACAHESTRKQEACVDRCRRVVQRCGDGSGSYTGHQRCDGRGTCKDGEDEEGCPALPVASCNGRQVPPLQVCDGRAECPGAVDEDAACLDDAFACADGSGRVQARFVCDTVMHCADGSDETGCAKLRCPLKSPLCADGSVSPGVDAWCNGIRDCQDGSDESKRTCDRGFFECASGEILLPDERCNDIRTCQDASDEVGCDDDTP